METVIGFASCPHVHSFKTLIFCTGGVKHQSQNVIGLPTHTHLPISEFLLDKKFQWNVWQIWIWIPEFVPFFHYCIFSKLNNRNFFKEFQNLLTPYDRSKSDLMVFFLKKSSMNCYQELFCLSKSYDQNVSLRMNTTL